MDIAVGQERNYYVEVSAVGNMMLELNEWTKGCGGSIKFLIPQPVNKNYLTIAANFDRLPVWHFDNHHYNMITATSGYRKMMRCFYMEPQLGFGFTQYIQKGFSIGSDVTLTFGAEAGFHKKKFIVAFNYRGVMGIIDSDLRHILSIKLGIKSEKTKKFFR